jgi:hypothetical protein
MLEEGHRFLTGNVQGLITGKFLSQLLGGQNPSSDELHTF